MSNLKDGISMDSQGKLDINLDRDEYDDVVQLYSKAPKPEHFTRNSITVYYGHVLIKPPTFNVADMETRGRDPIRTAIKNYVNLPSDTRAKLEYIIDHSIKKFNETFPIDQYDLIVSVDSSAPLNKLLIEKFRPYAKKDAIIIGDLYAKDKIESLDLDWEMLDREKSEETKKQVLDLYSNIMKNKSVFYIKDVRTGFRRYFIKFLKFKDQYQQNLFEHVFSKNVLLLDDTSGEVTTFREMVRLISEYKPKSYTCFAFLKDFRSNDLNDEEKERKKQEKIRKEKEKVRQAMANKVG